MIVRNILTPEDIKAAFHEVFTGMSENQRNQIVWDCWWDSLTDVDRRFINFLGNPSNISYTRDEPASWEQRTLTDFLKLSK